MSEGHQEPPGDVRSFLPRPGEPVEEYAQRLRGLHRDLTLVLQAVERGLQVASEPEQMPPPVPEEAPEAEPLPEPAPPPPSLDPPVSFGMQRHGGPRVEVLPAPSGERLRDPREERRGTVLDPEQDPPPLGPVPFPPRPSVREAVPSPPPEATWRERREDPRGDWPEALAPPPAAAPRARVEERPRTEPPREQPWAASSPATWSGDTRPAAEGVGGGSRLAPVLLILALTGWLAVLALVLALLV